MEYDDFNNHIIAQLLEALEKSDKQGWVTNCSLIFAYNGTGKTRLSRDFAHYGRTPGDEQMHTLYYNAYTEDLFAWDNDLENDAEPKMRINADSALIQGLPGGAVDEAVNKLMEPLTDIRAKFAYDDESGKPSHVKFSRMVYQKAETEEGGEILREDVADNIKISRGEERLFVWCFFRHIMDLAISGDPAYKWVKYIYIDDPISSLDDNNIIVFAQQLYTVINKNRIETHSQMRYKDDVRQIKFVVSTHHALFYHVMVHGLKADRLLGRWFLYRDHESNVPVLKDMGSADTPFFYNVAMMYELQRAIAEDKLYPYHFTIMRSIIEKIQEFFGHTDYRRILRGIKYKDVVLDDEDAAELYSRIVNVLTHQGAMFMPKEMLGDNKDLLKTLFEFIRDKYEFNIPALGDSHAEKDIKTKVKKGESKSKKAIV